MVADVKAEDGIMPNVLGMGARDAVYMLEKMGLKVRVSGTGDVKSQSIPAGTTLREGMACLLHMEG
ncbi:MAG: PASTA domain-containing protein, partial [Prevotella sp.]|nr:PASTA domain-containing protein [Prevotella sp.]